MESGGDRHANRGSRRGEVHVRRAAREARRSDALIDRSDGEHMRQARRVLERASPLSAVSGGRHDEGPRADGHSDHRIEHRVPDLRAEAEVDDALPAPNRGVEALDDVAGGDPVARRARIPDLERGLRIHPEQAEAVHRGSGNRRDRRPMLLELVRRRLGVQDGRARPGRELLVRHVHAGVDDGQRLARAGWHSLVRADDRDPPFLGFQRLCQGRKRVVGRKVGDETVARKVWEDANRGTARQPPDGQRRGDLDSPGTAKSGAGPRPCDDQGRVELSKLARLIAGQRSGPGRRGPCAKRESS